MSQSCSGYTTLLRLREGRSVVLQSEQYDSGLVSVCLHSYCTTVKQAHGKKQRVYEDLMLGVIELLDDHD